MFVAQDLIYVPMTVDDLFFIVRRMICYFTVSLVIYIFVTGVSMPWFIKSTCREINRLIDHVNN